MRLGAKLSSVLAMAVAVGCTAGSNKGVFGDTPTTTSGAGGFTIGTGGTGTGTLDGGPPCESRCSADLHSVVDCNGNILETCPDHQGCSPSGGCVSACQAAEENQSTFGCDFFSVTPAVIAESRGSCFAVMIANTWTTGITITAEYDGQSIDPSTYMYIPQGAGTSLSYQPLGSGELAAGQLGILFLSKYESGDIFQVDCPVSQALEMSTQVDNTGRGKAFYITTTAPIVAYDVYPWGGASSFVSSATLLIPTPAWGTNYVTADAWNAQAGQPFTQVVGLFDNTTVTMVATAAVQGGNGVPSMSANVPTPFTVNRGEVVQFVQDSRLAGTTLQADTDKPVGVWGGSTCMNIPDSATACDGAHQQL